MSADKPSPRILIPNNRNTRFQDAAADMRRSRELAAVEWIVYGRNAQVFHRPHPPPRFRVGV